MTAIQPKRQSLYDLAQDMLAWEALAEEAMGEVTPTLLEFEAELMQKLADKADAIGGFDKQLAIEANEIMGRADAVKDEHARLIAKAKAITAKRERLKTLIDTALTLTGQTKFEGTYFTLARQKNGGALPVQLLVEEKLVPDEFLDVETTVKVNKDRLRAALEAGDPKAQVVAAFGERGTRIVIK